MDFISDHVLYILQITISMLCSTTNVFCDGGVTGPLGHPLLIFNDSSPTNPIFAGLASWTASCTEGPLVNGRPVAVYSRVSALLDWIRATVYSNGGTGTGICCRGEGLVILPPPCTCK